MIPPNNLDFSCSMLGTSSKHFVPNGGFMVILGWSKAKNTLKQIQDNWSLMDFPNNYFSCYRWAYCLLRIWHNKSLTPFFLHSFSLQWLFLCLTAPAPVDTVPRKKITSTCCFLKLVADWVGPDFEFLKLLARQNKKTSHHSPLSQVWHVGKGKNFDKRSIFGSFPLPPF